MVKILKKEVIKLPKIDQKKILTIAEVENNTAKRLIYYLSFLNGSREDKKHRINKKTYELERKRAEQITTQTL
jgi:hypothetical protein